MTAGPIRDVARLRIIVPNERSLSVVAPLKGAPRESACGENETEQKQAVEATGLHREGNCNSFKRVFTTGKSAESIREEIAAKKLRQVKTPAAAACFGRG